MAETKTAIFAGGCFWCLQPPYDNAEGVVSTAVGYAGGAADTATYEQVGSGKTGHREVIAVTYDPAIIGYPKLLEIFWNNTDPSDAGGQYADRGFQYTTALYPATPQEREQAEASKTVWEAKIGKKVATTIEAATPFYPAEDYHQKYYKKNALRYQAYKLGSGR